MDEDDITDIEDLPDDIFDTITKEGEKIVDILNRYVPGIAFTIIENAFCSCIYSMIKEESRESYLNSFRKAAEASFKKWDKGRN